MKPCQGPKAVDEIRTQELNKDMKPSFVSRRHSLVALACAAFNKQAFALQESFPSKPIRLVVPYAPGSGTDLVARILAEELQHELGVAIIVDNRAGANGTIGSAFVAKAVPDGYTLLLGGSSTHSSAPSFYKKLPYDPERDFEMITNVVESQFLLVVRGESPVHDVRGLRDALVANKDKAAYGFGSATTQIAGAAFVKRLGLEIAAVPYKSNPQAMTDLMGGLVDFIFIDQTSAMQQIKAGKLRALAVASPQRMAEFPAVPTLAEAGVGDFNLQTWLGLLAPGGLPRPVADRLEAAMVKVMSRSSVRERLAVTGQPPGPSSRTVFPAYLKAQREAWSRKAEEAGIQPE